MFRGVKTLFHAGVGFIAVLLACEAVFSQESGGWISGPAGLSMLQLAILYGLAAALTEVVFRVERSPWRFVSLRDAFLLLRSTATTAVLVLVALFILNRAETLPRSILLLAWALQLGMLCGARLIRRAVYEGAINTMLTAIGLAKGSAGVRETLLIVGSVDDADSVIRDLGRDSSHRFHPTGVVTPSSADRGKLIRNVPVAGVLADWNTLLPALEKGGRYPQAVLFLTDPTLLLSAEQLGALAAANTTLLRLPRISEFDEGEPALVREIGIEELLSRPPVTLELGKAKEFISGKRILVTGAGGSIGSEICRQVASLGCAHLTMLDHSEFLLFNIDLEVGDHFPALSRQDVLCNVRDRARLNQWFVAEKPDVIFHAAALKHVSLVEAHPDQGFLTNVIGTMNVTEAAGLCGAADMVLISTDKAVAPTNVMGATKRLAESVVREAGLTSAARFTVVRFGNVLGSAGSVVPIFKDQIARGGPVTVTHLDVERYFMTIPEAVQLVLHAAATRGALPGDDARVGIHVLDMGNPVRVHDLAERMISLSGKSVGRDIEIQIVGLRPGEKLTEELIDETEEVVVRHAGVILARDRVQTAGVTRKEVALAERAAEKGDRDQVRRFVYATIDRLRATNDQTESA